MTEHEQGYRAYSSAGLTARCPFPPSTEARTRWYAGFNKAWNETASERVAERRRLEPAGEGKT